MTDFTRVVRIVRRYGIRFIAKNFVERVLFDLFNGTDTTRKVNPVNYNSSITELSGGHDYAGAFTSEINWVFKKLHGIHGKKFSEYFFVDVGCGKGKVLMVWQRLLKKSNIQQHMLGIECNGYLLSIARVNYWKVYKRNPNLSNSDACKFKYESLGPKGIFFLYNPFDASIMSEFSARTKIVEVWIGYNNPSYLQVLLDDGFVVKEAKIGRHVNETTVILHREAQR
jgi:hypothetical protein